MGGTVSKPLPLRGREMTLPSGTSSSRHRNNFDLLRLVFAFSVFLHHSYALTLQPALRPLTYVSHVMFAVNSFFVISGFLVFMSFDSSASWREFFMKRIRRIYPAYGSIVLLSVVLGAMITMLPLREYFSGSVRYAASNLVFLNFLEPSLPGVFDGNGISAVNGALWTIRTEVMCYFSVPFIVIAIRRFGRLGVLIGLYVLAGIIFHGLQRMQWQNSGVFQHLHYLPWHFLCFLSGGILYYYNDSFRRRAARFFVLAIVVYAVSTIVDVAVLMPISLAVMIITLACSFPYLGNCGKYGDLSYGMYIIHFPVIQTFIYFHSYAAFPLTTFVISTIVVVLLSFFSWHLIEKPFLRRSSHYRLSATKQ